MNNTQITILIIGIIGTICIIGVTYQDTIATVLGTMVGATLTGIFARMADPDFFNESGK